jgi:ATP-binding cassette subfamily B protein
MAIFTQTSLRWRTLLALQLGEYVIHDLRQGMFAHLQRLPMRFFQKTKIGRVISRFTSDAEAVRGGVQDVLFVALVNGGQMLVAMVFMLYYDRWMFLAVIAMAPVLFALNVYFRRRLSDAHRAMQESFSRVTGTLAESVNGIRVTQGFARHEVNARIFHELLKDHSRYNLNAARSSGIFVPLIELTSQAFLAAILFIGGWRVLNGHMQIENLYQFILLTGPCFNPIQTLASQYNRALSAMAGAERVFKFLDTPPEWTDPPDALTPDVIRGHIQFHNVGFAYDPDRPVLHDIAFEATPGATVALVGHTGSGKSSIANLIAKFYLPLSGQVLIDGYDILSLDTRALHRHMGIVLQQNFLFSGTVANNMRISRPHATDEDIREAARRLDCLDLLESLPDGLQTVVGERGAGISVGQRQLICFVRALLANPPILILDEATSAVDTLTETRLQKALALLLQGRTSIVIAHRLSTIRNADMVLVMEDGRIVERGSHRSLLLKKGVYNKLYQQFLRPQKGGAKRKTVMMASLSQY